LNLRSPVRTLAKSRRIGYCDSGHELIAVLRPAIFVAMSQALWQSWTVAKL
jgi:hypothetical protein